MSAPDELLTGVYILLLIEASYKLINEFCTQLGLDTCIKECTHFSQTKNSCLDQILSNSNFVSMSGVCNLNISDHQLVYVVRKKLKNIDKKISFWGRSYRNYDCHDFTNLLNNHDWTEILETECPNDIWRKLYDIILSYIDLQCPLKEFKIKKVKDPWVSPELLEFIKDKDKALPKAKKSKLATDCIIARRLRNECLQRVRNCKSEFMKNELNNNQDDSKKFWNTVKTVIPDNKNTNSKFHILDSDKQDYVSHENLPNFVNNFFC